MHNTIVNFIMIFVFSLLLMGNNNAFALDNVENAPKKWRIIYVEGGPYQEFSAVLVETAQALYEKRIIINKIPEKYKVNGNSKDIWQWLVTNASNEYIEFLSDGFYSFEWNLDTHKKTVLAINERIAEKQDVDMILSFGTAAGLSLVKSNHDVPILVLATTSAHDSGIVASRTDSGKDNVYAQIDSENKNYNLDVFHNIFNFKKLGVPVPITEEGRGLIGFANIEKSTKNQPFEIVPCELAVVNNANLQQDFKMCIEKLSKTSDAIFFPVIPGSENWAEMDELLAFIIDAGIPSFSQYGSKETKLGVLMSLARTNFQPAGWAAAEAMQKIFSGVKPRDIDQIVENSLKLELNLEMAMRIGWHPPFEVLASVDAVYKVFHTVDELDFETR